MFVHPTGARGRGGGRALVPAPRGEYLTFVINLAIVFYLLLAKRLIGLRGGAAADRVARERDSGWEALEELRKDSV